MKLLQEMNQPPQDNDTSTNKARKRATKPRRKWSEEETNHLLLGVNRHGVGKWTSILEDPDFKFNERSAGDLKDRFRTCCPDELRKSKKNSALTSPSKAGQSSKQKSQTETHLEKILIDSDASSPKDTSNWQNESDALPRQKRSRAHRKQMQDLVELGIHGPFKKSHRRERRPFTEQDDQEILQGLNRHGPAWTKIQRDSRFHLSSRQPTDLRDRVRNKYPTIYQRIEKGIFQTKYVGRGNEILEPSVSFSVESSLKPAKSTSLEMHMNRSTSREEVPRWSLQRTDTGESLSQSSTLENGDNSVPHLIGGEMDISRLLLDDAKFAQVSSRFGTESAGGTPLPSNSSRPPNMEGMPRPSRL